MIQWGIIGCGNVTEVKSGPGLRKADGSELVAVMRRNGELAADYARRHQVSKWYDDVNLLVNDPDVNAVYIATPPGSHLDYVKLVAGAGKPVYVEKPMARTYAECLEMIQICEQHGTPLFVAYYRRAQPRFLKVKELIENGAIGTVRMATTRHVRLASPNQGGEIPWRLQREHSGGGLFFDVGSHTLDLLDFLLGPIEEASGYAANLSGVGEVEDTVGGSYRFASGAVGSGLWCFAADRNEDRNEIVGDRGRIVFSTFDDLPVQLERGGGTEQWSIPQPEHVQQPLIQTVVDELLGRGACPSTGKTAARTSWVMDRLVEGFY